MDHAVKRVPVQELHDDGPAALERADRQRLNDGVMLEPASEARLVHEHLDDLRILLEVVVESLDDHELARSRVRTASEQRLGHAAVTEPREDLVTLERLEGLSRRLRSDERSRERRRKWDELSRTRGGPRPRTSADTLSWHRGTTSLGRPRPCSANDPREQSATFQCTNRNRDESSTKTAPRIHDSATMSCDARG